MWNCHGRLGNIRAKGRSEQTLSFLPDGRAVGVRMQVPGLFWLKSLCNNVN